ncbi:MAG: hypothetical protein IIA08_00420 [Proteobacteria bacterium]|nr:hypothetical protein [Pseudomonadota bacterium]
MTNETVTAVTIYDRQNENEYQPVALHDDHHGSHTHGHGQTCQGGEDKIDRYALPGHAQLGVEINSDGPDCRHHKHRRHKIEDERDGHLVLQSAARVRPQKLQR